MVERITISWDYSDRAKRRIFAAESNTIIMGLLSKIFSNTRKPEGFKAINIRKDEAKHWLMVTVEK